jgi:putative two-component system response regulator
MSTLTPEIGTAAFARADVFRLIRAADARLAGTDATPAATAVALRPLVRCASAVDAETTDHVHRVAGYARGLAQACGWTGAMLDCITVAAVLHDIGKIGVPASLLAKPGALTRSERNAVERHTTLGDALLRGCKSPQLRVAREVAAHHHERWDGAGYPHGLAGNQIPASARIVALADVFDALTTDRPYRRALSTETALEMISDGTGTQFDPTFASTFLNLHRPARKCA